MGHRGCRLGLTNPEIYATQCEQYLKQLASSRDSDITVIPEVMIPLVADAPELERCRQTVVNMAEHIISQYNVSLDQIGTRSRSRAALQAGSIAQHADFFSFGTNDLTQRATDFPETTSESFFHSIWQRHSSGQSTVIDIEGVGERLDLERTVGDSQCSVPWCLR